MENSTDMDGEFEGKPPKVGANGVTGATGWSVWRIMAKEKPVPKPNDKVHLLIDILQKDKDVFPALIREEYCYQIYEQLIKPNLMSIIVTFSTEYRINTEVGIITMEMAYAQRFLRLRHLFNRIRQKKGVVTQIKFIEPGDGK